jgi:hypothetical protein
MNSKERVLQALGRNPTPDRVPIQFDLCQPLLARFLCGLYPDERVIESDQVLRLD